MVEDRLLAGWDLKHLAMVIEDDTEGVVGQDVAESVL